MIYKQPVQVVSRPHSLAAQYLKASPTPRPLEVLFSPTPRPYKTLPQQPLQLRALPQTAEEYTSSDTPNYYPHYVSSTPSPGPVSGYYAPSVSSTAATPIEEDQDDIPRPATKPAPISNYYATSTPAPPSVRYILVHPSQYYDES